MRGIAATTVAAVALGLAAVGCGGGDDATPPPPTTTTTAAGDPALATPDPRAAGTAYLALGDSLAQGVQRKDGSFGTTREGYPDQLASRLRDAGTPVTLSRIGCSGATVSSLLDGGRECGPAAPEGPPYENRDAATSQLAYAETYLRARGDRPTLVTIDIGANDLIGCAGVDPTKVRSCLADGLPQVRTRLQEVARRLQDAAGPRTVLAAMTYYDPALALVRQPLAKEAATAFHDIVRRQANPTIRRTFAAQDFVVARVDRAFDSDGPVSDAAVQKACALTRLCGAGADFHPNAEGYGVIADAFLDVVRAPVARVAG
ncbi:SGNH/GDSL hydrolase family protein [Patulibacter sp.]|uniref:SGNH/GDSL hydrolase family protein n=1 Tax=Patulibacter sp. TaxID=1912859 RepID=UPI00271A5D3D|nr:SGNH/GDSL hydrolase family protein [Patulibacter sp.]MDO9408888.1 SGNH/GDSL hydrolase family protein [Patulibacter sp.]